MSVIRLAALLSTSALGMAAVGAQSLAAPFLGGTTEEVWTPTTLHQYVFHGTPGVVLRYTTNGTDPVVGDPTIAPNTFIPIKRNATFKAKAWSGATQSTTSTRLVHLIGNVAAGSQHALLLKASRELFAAGLQSNGRLGNGSTGSGNISTFVASRRSGFVAITDATDVGAGVTHSVFLGQDGSVWGFGTNGSGELGNNSTSSSQAVAVQVNDTSGGGTFLASCHEVSAGLNFSGARRSDGKVFTWGSQSNGRLGNGQNSGTKKYAVPVKTSELGNPDLAGIYEFDLGDTGGLARVANSSEVGGGSGHVWAWGGNSNGQLGLGTTSSTESWAKQVRLNSGAVLTDAWTVSQGAAHGAIVRWKAGDPELQGSVWCMGLQTHGRLGNNVTGTGNTVYPVKVVKADGTTLLGIEQVSAGPNHTLALDTSGQVWAWGYNTTGAVGDASTTHRIHAVKVQTPKVPGDAGYPGYKDLTGITQIAAGGTSAANFSLALAENGALYAWGSNSNGQFGAASPASVTVATPVAAVNVLPTPPDATLSANVTQGFTPGAVTLTAAVTDPDGLANIQKVEFYHQGALVGTRTAAPWSVSLTGLAAGSHHAYAIVTDLQGNTGMSLPVDYTIVVSNAPSISLQANVTPALFPGAATLVASPVDPDGDIARVDFYCEGGLVGQLSAPPWQLRLNHLLAGDYGARAVVTDQTGKTGSSALITFSIVYDPNAPNLDQDGDGLIDSEEVALGTSAQDADTDGDGIPDGIDSAPLVPATVPVAAAATLMVWSPLD